MKEHEDAFKAGFKAGFKVGMLEAADIVEMKSEESMCKRAAEDIRDKANGNCYQEDPEKV